MSQQKHTFNTHFDVTVLTGADADKRKCDYCQQTNRKVMVHGTNDPERDICDECITAFAAAIITTKP